VKFTADVVAPLHSVWLETAFTVGVGLTVIVKVVDAPTHPLAVGVTMITAVTGALAVFVAVNAAISPVPVAASPIEVALFVQLNVVPLTEPLKLTAVVVAPLHKVWFDTLFTSGVGLIDTATLPVIVAWQFVVVLVATTV
jgi:hypothetical protein